MSKRNPQWARGPRIRRVMDEDGVLKTEKVPNLPHVFYVDRNGNMRTIVLTNGQHQSGQDHSAGIIRMRRCDSKGFFAVHECPMHRPDMIQFVDEDLRDAPCNAGDFGRRKMCRHVKEMQRRRMAACAERNRLEEEKYKSWQQKQYEMQKEEHKATLEALQKTVLASAPKRKTKEASE